MTEWRRIELHFRCKRGFPGVVGAVDGSLIAIQRPADFNGFYCRNNYPAINVQGIVDADQKFMAIDMYPGSWSDKKMWKYAPSRRRFRENMPIETHLLGDSGYTNDSGITFGKWKGRFRKLMTVMSEKDVKKACRLIAATAVLHNLFEILADDTQIEIVREPPDDEVDFGPVSATTLRAIAVSKRNAIMSLITR
ncbi:unnamed protein product [Phytophthora fragariaefolia]|uniref:Unnamed protein product n=1 Tax=Phytophthora fragariaefolia TaxID=1490495 RepID=A0A9W6YAC2_9STRA|nr:unnamed protein product [Phytophthora fragariaefolia]